VKVLRFKTAASFRRWLGKNHDKSDGIWVHFFKKNSGEKSLTYAEALDQALCHGWIDSQANPFDELSWIQKYTPRRSRSVWSKRNTEHVERLISAGAMTSSGMKAIEAAKTDGRWDTAYASAKNAQPPEDFLKALRKNKKALAFFNALNRANIYAIVYRLQSAKKPETRERRLKLILEMMDQGKTFHPLPNKPLLPQQ
jgi:uncharacterized protein YdeI (YjbR/CyaY-like superfamily)